MKRRDSKPAEQAPQALDQPLHVRYRPKRFVDVLGQDAVVKSLEKLVTSKNPGHAYLFTGPSGTGKTTLARILAHEFNCDPNNITEVDAASNNGIDAMREVTAQLRYHGFGDTPNKAIIIDECHGLSKQAWDSLLKALEEPPPHVFFFLCTTEPGKVKDTIATRCHSYTLKPVKYDDVMDMLERIAELERMDTPQKILQLVGRACNGSMRQALVMLSMVRACDDEEEAGRLLETALESKEVIDLCRLLLARKLKWSELVGTLKAMPEMSPESVRIVVVNYLAACAMGARSEDEAARILDIMFPFSKPFNTSDKLAPLLLAFGDVLFH